jgi:UDP-2,3-diacylglucosamine hydrolase
MSAEARDEVSGTGALGILAGGGRFPILVAEAALARGRPVIIAAIRGEADPAVTAFPHVWIGRGQVGTLISLLNRHGARELVIIGGIRQRRLPYPSEMDFSGIFVLIRNWRLLKSGDDGTLRKIARILETRDIRVVGAAEVAPELLMPVGALGAHRPGGDLLADIARGLGAARAHGDDDLGQAVIAADGMVALKEGPAGTDAMIGVWATAQQGRPGRRGVLVKCPKPRQDRRLDMPAIGPDTVRTAAAAGLAGIAVEAGGTIVADRDEVVRIADEAGLFVWGIDTGEGMR